MKNAIFAFYISGELDLGFGILINQAKRWIIAAKLGTFGIFEFFH